MITGLGIPIWDDPKDHEFNWVKGCISQIINYSDVVSSIGLIHPQDKQYARF